MRSQIVILKPSAVEFMGGLFCEGGFASQVDLETFLDYLDSDEVQQAKAKLTAEIRESEETKRSLISLAASSIRFFQDCVNDTPDIFYHDPLFIDRSILDLQDWSLRFSEREWPELYSVIRQLEAIAQQTRAQRLAMLVPCAVPLGESS